MLNPNRNMDDKSVCTNINKLLDDTWQAVTTHLDSAAYHNNLDM
jgi:hypothetical protein